MEINIFNAIPGERKTGKLIRVPNTQPMLNNILPIKKK